ncbi:hypothetical protein KJ965_04740 [Patescibacteria group bacterium]|nr:hypothetical protein [Patescibacteria group bacterium]
MDNEKVIYSLCVEDILTVIEDNDMEIKLNEEDIKFIEDKIGDIIDWRGAIEFALWEIKNKKEKTIQC